MRVLQWSACLIAGLLAVASTTQASTSHSQSFDYFKNDDPAPPYQGSAKADDDGEWAKVFKTAEFTGDLSKYFGGTISFEAKTRKIKPADPAKDLLLGKVTFRGAEGSASLVLAGADKSAGKDEDGDERWRIYSAKLESTDLTLLAVLRHVERIDLGLEFANGITPPARFDNLHMSQVPIPGSVWLMAGGMGLLLATMRYSRTSARVVPFEAHT